MTDLRPQSLCHFPPLQRPCRFRRPFILFAVFSPNRRSPCIGYSPAQSVSTMAATSSSSSSPTSAHADTELIDKNPTSFTAYELDADAKKSAHGGLGGAPNAVDDESDAVRMATKSTRDDAYNMFRMGKKQQFVVWHFNPPPTKLEDDADPSAQRQFRLISTVAFVSLATAAWELGILSVLFSPSTNNAPVCLTCRRLISPGLEDGGIPGLLYSLVWSFLGALPVYLSLAEMASM